MKGRPTKTAIGTVTPLQQARMLEIYRQWEQENRVERPCEHDWRIQGAYKRCYKCKLSSRVWE